MPFRTEFPQLQRLSASQLPEGKAAVQTLLQMGFESIDSLEALESAFQQLITNPSKSPSKLQEAHAGKESLDKPILDRPLQGREPFAAGTRAMLKWKNPVTAKDPFWPCTIHSFVNYVRVEVLTGNHVRFAMKLNNTNFHFEGLKDTAPIEDSEKDGKWRHSIKFQYKQGMSTITSTRIIINSEPRLPVGSKHTFENFTMDEKPILDLGWMYTVEADGNAGLVGNVMASRLCQFDHACKAPADEAYPQTGVLKEVSEGSSSILFHNLKSDRALYVMVCKLEDRNASSPTPLASLFIRAGETTRPGAKLPAGTYHLRLAMGNNWLGPKAPRANADGYGDSGRWHGVNFLFGPGGSYLADKNETELRERTNLTVAFPSGSHATLMNIDPFDF